MSTRLSPSSLHSAPTLPLTSPQAPPLPLSPFLPIACTLLNTPLTSPVLCFQWVARSFHKTPGIGVSSSQLLFGISNIQTLFPPSCLQFSYSCALAAASSSDFRFSSFVFRPFCLRYNPLALPTLSPAKVQPGSHCGIPNTFEVS